MVLRNSFKGRKNQPADNVLKNFDGGGCPSTSQLSFAMLQAHEKAPAPREISWRTHASSFQLQVSYEGEIATWKLYSLDEDPPVLHWTVATNDPVQIYRFLLKRANPDENVLVAQPAHTATNLPFVGGLFLSRYQITNRLAKGGMGQIFQATDVKANREVAIKVLHFYLADDSAARVRFEREMKACINLKHPNIVTVYDYGYTQEDTPYMVMEYLKGSTLEDLLRLHGPMPIDRFAHFFRQVADALRSAHDNQIIHRDIKPANIVLIDQGADCPWLIKLLDFGIAKNLETISPATMTGEVVGTPYYMSPEQCQNEPQDLRTDIYSLGCVMYEALCGRKPIQGETPANTMMMHILKQPDPLMNFRPDVPKELENIVAKAMAKNPNNRYQNGHQLLEALLEFEIKNRH
jgi:hypothetical protein